MNNENNETTQSTTNKLCFNSSKTTKATIFNHKETRNDELQNRIISIVSSNGWKSGYHEWIFKILKCGVYRQEIGVIGIGNIQNMRIDINGIKDTYCFGARAFYGN